MNTLQKRYQEALQSGQVFILTPEDIKFGVSNGKEIKSIDDLVMVHKTNYFPEGAIKTPFDTKKSAQSYVSFDINGEVKEYPITFKNFRDTIHFCLNGSVDSHAYGDWDESKYAIFMPLAQNKDKIVAGTECDLFTKGSVPLNDTAYILCPKDEIAKTKNRNPQVNVVGYEGESVSAYVNVFLAQVLGYKFKEPTENSRCWNSGFGKDAELAVSIIKNNGWTYTDHNGSIWSKEELRLQKIDLLVQVINIINSEKFLYSEENVKNIYDVVYGRLDTHDLFQGYSFGQDLSEDSTFEEICSKVQQATGIDMNTFIDGTHKNDKSWYYFGELEKKLTDTIIKQLRMKCLIEKEQLGTLTEKETIQLQFEREFGDWQNALNNGILSKDFISGIATYESLLDRDLSTLSRDEIQIILNVINVKLGLLSKSARDKQQKFNLEFIKEVTPEMSKSFQDVGQYIKVRNAGIYLTFTAPDKTQKFTELSGVNMPELINIINYGKTSDEVYEAEKQIALLPNSHIDEFGMRSVITDCQLSDCQTVKVFGDRIIKYANNFLQFYNGKKIQFDRNGNLIQEPVVFFEVSEELDINSISRK